jgi:signal transduction histidine kinase/cytochrome c553
MAWFRAGLSLQQRIPLLIGFGLVFILAAFAILSLQAIDDSRQRALQERLLIAELAAKHIDLSVEEALQALEQIARAPEVDLADGNDEPERRILTHLHEQTKVFGHSLFLLDLNGEPVVTVPAGRSVALKSHEAGQRQIQTTIEGGQPAVSGLQCSTTASRPVVCLTVPVLDREGNVAGLLGGSFGLGDPSIAGFIGGLQLGQTGYTQIVDQEGLVLAGTRAEEAPIEIHSTRFAALIDEKRSVVTACHSCHEHDGGREVRQDIIAFAPLSFAPWGVTINQAEEEVFAPATRLQQQAFLLSGFAILSAIGLAWFGTRAIVSPIGHLTSAAERIAGGDLSEAVEHGGKDEIGRLAAAFETMRLRLQESLASIQGWNRDLEQAVARRTRELEASQEAISLLYEELSQKEIVRGQLLQKVIAAQEEERRRIARELHDETSQALAALAVGLEAALDDPQANPEAIRRRLDALKPLIVNTMEEVHNLIFDLRPACLDDLGLVAALQWYGEKRLQELGIAFELSLEGEERRLPTQIETTLFRVAQEAITNVIKHAEADAVQVELRFGRERVTVSVADDGRGFDAGRIAAQAQDGAAYGLLGMQERVDLLGGILRITSRPGEGTRVQVAVPLAPEEVAVG